MLIKFDNGIELRQYNSFEEAYEKFLTEFKSGYDTKGLDCSIEAFKSSLMAWGEIELDYPNEFTFTLRRTDA